MSLLYGGAYFFAPLLYLHSSTEIAALQERILSENDYKKLEKMRIDKDIQNML